MVNILLWAPDGGIEYQFDMLGEAGPSEANFVLDISRDSVVVHTVEFSLPLAHVSASDGDTGSGQTSAAIYPDALNEVTIRFEWTSKTPPESSVLVTLEFYHPPSIIEWSAVPGPGVTADTDIAVQADVEFFGDGSSESVEAQFWDTDADVGAGSPVSLTYSGGTLWEGTIPTVLGAEELRLTAEDDEGTTVSAMPFVVSVP